MNELDLRKFNQAIQFAQNGQTATARYILTELAHQYPQEANIWLWLTFTSTDRRQAQQALEKVAQLDPANPNLGQATAWVEQQFPAVVPAPPNASIAKPAKVEAPEGQPESKNSGSKFSVATLGLILFSVAGLVAVFVIFTSAVNGFALGTNSAMFNSDLPTPGTNLASRIYIKDNVAQKLEEATFAGKSQEAIAQAKAIKHGYFVVKTADVPKVMKYYENYVGSGAVAPSYSGVIRVYWCSNVKNTREYLGVTVLFQNSKAEFAALTSRLDISLKSDEAILYVAVGKMDTCSGTKLVLS